MLTRLFTVALAATLLVFPAKLAQIRALAAKARQASVVIHAKGITYDHGIIKSERIGCSGTYISSTHILTAAHCFGGYIPTGVWARSPDELLGTPAKIIKMDSGADLAILEVAFPHTYARLGVQPHVGDDIVNVGSPGMFEFVVSQGIVGLTDFKCDGYTGRYTITTAMINSGSSGGGAFDSHGRLVGVNTMSVGMFGWQGISMAVDLPTIKHFIDN